MLLKVADIEERHMRARTKTLVSLLAPVLIMVVGALVGLHGHRHPAAHLPDEQRHPLKETSMKTRTHRNPAFTLIEIMVVVVILGILAATIIPQFVGTTTTPKSAPPRRTLWNWNTPWNASTSTWTVTQAVRKD